MSDVSLKIDTPISVIVDALSRVIVAGIENDTERRATMSQDIRDDNDREILQAKRDLRHILELAKIVGPRDADLMPAPVAVKS